MLRVHEDIKTIPQGPVYNAFVFYLFEAGNCVTEFMQHKPTQV